MARQGEVVWSELMTTEIDKAKAFYGRTLGLTFEAHDPTGDGNYWVAMADGEAAWGLMDMTSRPESPTGWFTYLAVDDVDARVAAAEAAGGKLLVPVFDVPSVGRIAVLQDPTGAVIGWMKPVDRSAA
ncbi:VOC family protein [Aestuariivirga sp.]|jgi:predicted enzyme related to lactoylglutathione lyase|uniref:VOC family protein n=1 Tax=Aestuariivirga sp. TaxID=2650926 RepID=UPI0037838C84